MSLFSDSPARSQTGSAEWIHAHCDGGSRGNPGPSGFGAVITDSAGETLAELSEFLGIRTNNVAEYSGLLAVLQWTIENHRTRLKVVSDSELMVRQIQGKYKVNSADLKPLWQQAIDRIAQLDGFEISHALREENKAADALANQAMDKGMRHNGLSTDPIFALPAKARSAPPLAPATPPAASKPEPVASRQEPATSSQPQIEPLEPEAYPTRPTMLRGVVKNGSVQILGSTTLPDGTFVKIIRE